MSGHYVYAATAADWSALIGKRIRFDYHQPWEDLPFTNEGVLEKVEVEAGDSRYPQIWLWGEWGGVVPDLETTVEVIGRVGVNV